MAYAMGVLRSSGRILWLLIALAIIGVAILVTLGRLSIAEIDRLRPDVQNLISERLGLQVQLGELSGQWPGLLPELEVSSLRILATDGSTAVDVGHMRAALDIYSSVRHRALIWRKLTLDKASVTLVENAEGHWQLKSFNSSGEDGSTLLVEGLMHSRIVRLTKAGVRFEFYSGNTIEVGGHDLILQNQGDFHRLETQVYLSEDEQSPAYLVVEGDGDPLDLQTFQANGYLQLSGINLSQPVAMLASTLLPELFGNLRDFAADASGELWFDVQQGGAIDYLGQLKIGRIPLDWLADVPEITEISSTVTGWFAPGVDWGARLQGFSMSWSGEQIEPLDLVFTQDLGSGWRNFDLSLNHLNVGLLTELLRKTQLPVESIFTVVENLRPAGKVNALTFGYANGGYYASANLEDFAVASWHESPAFDGVSGYLELRDQSAYFQLDDRDGFRAEFPGVYEHSLQIEKARGRVDVSWTDGGEYLRVASSPLFASVDAGDATVQFTLEKWQSEDLQQSRFGLLIGAVDIDGRYRDTYIPDSIPKSLATWIDTAVKALDVDRFGLVMHENQLGDAEPQLQSQMLYDVSNLNLDYAPGWQVAEGVKALVLVDNNALEGSVTAGTIGDAQLTEARVTYTPENDVLNVDGVVAAPLAEAMRILGKSPVAESMGALSEWQYQGQMEAGVHLSISLGVEDDVDPDYRVDARIMEGELQIPDTPVTVQAINGTLNYSRDDGLSGRGVTARFYGQPLWSSMGVESGVQVVRFDGSYRADLLPQLVDFDWPAISAGSFKYQGKLTLNPPGQAEPVWLDITSDLQGFAINLPEPLGKPAAQPQALQLTLAFDEGLQRISGKLGEQLGAQLLFDRGALDKGLVSYQRAVGLPAQSSQLLLAARLPALELAQWEPYLALFERRENASDTAFDLLFDAHIDSLDIASLPLRELQVAGQVDGDQVAFSLRSNLADGQLQFPFADKAVPVIDLSRLVIPRQLLEQQASDGEVDPRSFPALDFSVADLSVGDEHWGNLAFSLRPEVAGAAFNHIRGSLFGLRPGQIANKPKTEFFWHYDGQVHSSRLVGPVALDNIADVFAEFEIPPVAESNSGLVSFDLAWPDKPWAFSKEILAGDIRLELLSGQLYQSQGGAGATLRLISLINFANWLRRLKLDFSDVFGKNLAYDRVAGVIHLEDGISTFTEPLLMEMPSGRMSMGGQLDLVHETIDAELVATLPVATNLPWLVALAGGLPAAAGVYITSKLLEKEVDRLSSIAYQVKGPWDDVDIEVDKIFAEELKGEAK